MLQPQRAFVSAMREQSMEASADTHRTEDVVANGQPQHTPPTENIRQEGKWNQQMKEHDTDNVRPDDPAFIIDQCRSWDSPAANRSRRRIAGDQFIQTIARLD